jgi:GTPase SAR1 family protein
MISSYYRDCEVAIIIFDVTARSSFTNVHAWIKEIDKNVVVKKLLRVLVASKIDKEREVSRAEVNELALTHGMVVHEVSSLLLQGIDELFIDIAQRVSMSP